MKKHLTNDQCVPYIRERTDFANKRASLTGKTHTPGADLPLGHLPEDHHLIVREAEFVVFSYATPIAWYGPLPAFTPEAVEEFLAGPGLDDLEAFLTGAAELPRQRAFPSGGEMQWQMPAVRYSRTTSQHQYDVYYALAYEKTWREADDGKAVPSDHADHLEWHTTEYNKFARRPASTGGVNW